MRFILFCVLAVSVLASKTERVDQLWDEYKVVRSLSFANAAEEQRVYEIFRANFFAIIATNDELQSKQASFRLGVNNLAHLSPEEFRSTYLMPRPAVLPTHPTSRHAPLLPTDALPTSFDWRTHSPPVVTPVRDQGSVGSCWAFSTAANVEGQWALAGHPLTVLSTEQIVDCANSTAANGNEDCGVFGGWPYLTYEWLIQVGGLESEQQYPYCCGTGDCYPCYAPGTSTKNCGPAPSYCNITQNQCNKFNPVAKIQSWVAIATDENQIAAQLVQRGPLSVLLNADLLQFYSNGIFAPSGCDATNLDHAVLIVGYGVDNGTPYWSVKNSWSATWGENGYFRIARGQGMCGINLQVTSSVVG